MRTLFFWQIMHPFDNLTYIETEEQSYQLKILEVITMCCSCPYAANSRALCCALKQAQAAAAQANKAARAAEYAQAQAEKAACTAERAAEAARCAAEAAEAAAEKVACLVREAQEANSDCCCQPYGRAYSTSHHHDNNSCCDW